MVDDPAPSFDIHASDVDENEAFRRHIHAHLCTDAVPLLGLAHIPHTRVLPPRRRARVAYAGMFLGVGGYGNVCALDGGSSDLLIPTTPNLSPSDSLANPYTALPTDHVGLITCLLRRPNVGDGPGQHIYSAVQLSPQPPRTALTCTC